jgi:hypothetical protein
MIRAAICCAFLRLAPAACRDNGDRGESELARGKDASKATKIVPSSLAGTSVVQPHSRIEAAIWSI